MFLLRYFYSAVIADGHSQPFGVRPKKEQYMKKTEVHRAMYYYALVLRALGVLFSGRKFHGIWTPPRFGFDVIKSEGITIGEIADEARKFGLSDDDSLAISCTGFIIRPVGWSKGYSISISSMTMSENEDVVKIKLFLRYPIITGSGAGWCFRVIIEPKRITVFPVRMLPKGAQQTKDLLALFKGKKSIVI